MFPDSRPDADRKGVESLERNRHGVLRHNTALASTTVGGIGSLEPDTIYYQKGLPFDNPKMRGYYPETSSSPGAVVSHELMHRSSRLPEIRESYNEYAPSRYYRDAGKGHAMLGLLEAEMDTQKGWPNPEAITELMEKNPELTL